jgi:alkanesulfonate monooxygenase SsuD/methylene tetrahydromethanopterin reductase-like flavin-dependent oxidoreductase (luciferase family)
MKIYTAAITPKGLAVSGEVADGVFPVWMDPEKPEALVPYIEEGIAKRDSAKGVGDFDIAPFVTCIVGDDLDACRMPVKGMLSLYIGGMGARGKNFYTDYATRLGYEEAALKIQDLYLDGKKAEALAAVPDELADSVSLVGTRERIAERVEAWKKSPATTLLLGAQQPEAIQLLAELVL